MKGVYIREPIIDKPKEYSISVEPVFHNEDQIGKIKVLNYSLTSVLFRT